MNIIKIISMIIVATVVVFLGCVDPASVSPLNEFGTPSSTESFGYTGTSIKEINQNPQSNIGSSIELSGIVFTTEENGLWFEFTDDRRIFDRRTIDEYRIIYVHNTIGFNAEKQLESYKPGDVLVKGIIKMDDNHGLYIEATDITLK